MVSPFEPKDGVQPRWRYAYDLVIARKPGDGITLMELAELLDLDHFSEADRQVMRGVMLEAKAHLEKEGQQTVETVVKYGWKVLDPTGNLDQIEQRRLKAARQVDRTARLINATPRSELAPIDQQRYDAEQRSALAAGSLFTRKRSSFAEMVRRSKPRKELPGR